MADRWNEQENDQNIRNRMSFGGTAAQSQVRQNNDGTFTTSRTGGSAEQMANQYTSMGQAAAQRQAYQNDWSQANAARNGQGDATRLMQSAAYGNEPSQAQMLGRNMIDQSLQAQMAAGASARGGSLAQAAAMRNAALMGDASRQQGMNQLSALRAQEMAQARGQYMDANSAMRGMDMQQQGMNMQSELAQRQLNQQGQQFYDQMGWNTTKSEQDAAIARAQLESQEYIAQKQVNQHSQDRETGAVAAGIGAVGSMIGGFLSDVSAKTNVQPLSAADSAYINQAQGQYDGIAKASDRQYAMDKQDAAGRAKFGQAMQGGFGQLGQFGTSMSQGGVGGAPMSLGKFYGGGGGMMMSDARAKREAFEEGVKYADMDHAGKPIAAPSYVKEPPPVTAAAQAPAQAPAPSMAQAIANHPATQAAARGVGMIAGGPMYMGALQGADMGRQYAQAQPRAEGGPVDAGQPYLVGERGPELVVPRDDGVVIPAEQTRQVIDLDDDVTMTDPKDEPAFQAWKKKYAHPQDNGEDYDLRGAWKAGLKPGPDGHWPDTFKRPNHETFSDESKYARNEGARPGHWNGDEFVPYSGPGTNAYMMRDGAPDDRTRHFDESFHRDTPADQARVKRAVEDKAGRDADEMMAGMRANLARGPATSDAMARANRSMEGASYAYKPEFTPPEQQPGERNVGPMAQNMAADPVAATAVKRDPETGMLVLDAGKMTKLNSAGIASLQRQVDSLATAVAKKGRS